MLRHAVLRGALLQVTLDSAAVLQRRHKQYSQLLASLGLQHRTLAACVQPANKVSTRRLQECFWAAWSMDKQQQKQEQTACPHQGAHLQALRG
jgi:hypothetical protein